MKHAHEFNMTLIHDCVMNDVAAIIVQTDPSMDLQHTARLPREPNTPSLRTKAFLN